MKTTIATLTAVLAFCTTMHASAHANDVPNERDHTTSVMASYSEATTAGKLDWNTLTFTEDFTYENVATGVKAGQKAYRKFLSENEGLQYDCQTSYAILDETNDVCIAKVTLAFANFTRVDYVTLNKSQGWSVSKVVTTYP